MSFVLDDDEQEEVIQEEEATPEVVLPKPKKEPYQSNVVTSKEIDLSSLVTYLTGSRWNVDYYSNVLGKDQVPTTQQVNELLANQQYIEYKGLELIVQSELTSDQNQETSEFEVTGSSNIYPSVKPNNGDMLIADVGDGRAAIFTVTSNRRLTIYKESAYEIGYRLVDFMSEEIMADLQAKVVESKYFDLERLREGHEPFVTEDDIIRTQNVTNLIETLTGAYRRLFWNDQYSTLVYQEDDNTLYDHFLVDFLKTIDLPWDKRVSALNCSTLRNIDEPNLWSLILDPDNKFLRPVEMMNDIECRTLSQVPSLGSIAYSNIKFTREPLVGKAEIPTIEDGFVFSDGVHPSTLDGFYVLSGYFYNNIPDGMSKLERYLKMWLDGKSLETSEILEVANSSKDWEDLTKFYQIPILLVLLQSLIR